jgi:hypothetical protein
MCLEWLPQPLCRGMPNAKIQKPNASAFVTHSECENVDDQYISPFGSIRLSCFGQLFLCTEIVNVVRPYGRVVGCVLVLS